MQKWHVHSAVGKGRPLLGAQSPHYLLRCLHTTALKSPQVARDPVKHETHPPLPSRASRLRTTSTEIQKLHNKSAINQDTRKSTTNIPSEASQGFRVRYQGQDGIITTPKLPDRATVPADIKERLRQRALQRSQQGQRGGDITGATASRPISPSRQESRPPPPSTRQRSSRGRQQEGDGKKQRANVDPVPRGRGRNAAPSRAFNAQDDDFHSGSNRKTERARQAMEAYEDSIIAAACKNPDSVLPVFTDLEEAKPVLAVSHAPAVEPKVETRDALMMAQGPAAATGGEGMREILAVKLVLASKVLNGDLIQWTSREEKEDVQVLVEQLKHANPDTLVKGKADQPARTGEEVEKLANEMLERVAKGQYGITKPRQGDTMGHVEMSVAANKSYFPVDERRLVEEVRGVLGTGNVQAGKGERPTVRQKQKLKQ